MTMSPWRRYAAIFDGLALRLAGGAALSIVAGLALVPTPLLIGRAFDRVIPSGRIDALVALGFVLLGCQILGGACAIATRVIVLRTTKQAIARLRREAIAKLFSLSRSYYGRHAPSYLHNVVVQETERIDVMSNALVAELAPAMVLSLGVSAVLLVLNWPLFLTMMAVMPANVAAGRLLSGRVRTRTRRFHESFERFSRGVLFVIRAIDRTRILAAEELETNRQAQQIDELRQTSMSAAVAGAAYSVTQQTLLASAGVVVLVAGGSAVSAGRMTIGSLVSFFAGLMLLRMPLHTILTSYPRVIEGVEALGAVSAFLGDEDRAPYQGISPVAFTGRIVLDDVTFSYGDRPVLTHVSLALEPGETVALFGPNGAGKSTIVNLILGFYRPQAGTVSADGVRLDDADMRALRRQIGVVMQEPIMVPGTIRDNLLYGAPDEPWDAVIDACRRAGVDAFVSDFPLGYDTPIGEAAENLSGGQRQRLSIACALLGRPRLLILDEPMNHLDERSGPEFFRRLTAGRHPPAVLLISHRPDVLSVADRVLHLEEGRIVRVDQPTPIAIASSAGSSPSW